MKTASFLAAAFGVAMAQDFTIGQPSCATGCLSSAISVAGCGPNDVACQCGPTQSVIIASVVGCLISSCNPSDLNKASTAGEARCASYSATAVTSTTTSGVSATTASNSTITTQSSGSSTTSGSSSTGSAAITSTRTGTSAATTTGATSTRSSASRQNSPTSSANAAVVEAGVGAGLVLALLGAVAGF